MRTKRERNMQLNQWAVTLALTMMFLLENGPAVAADGRGVSIGFILGTKSLDSYWEPTDSQSEWGVGLVFHQPESRVNLEMGFLMASSNEESLDSSFFGMTDTSEIFFGTRKVFDESDQVKLYIHGGLAMVSMEVTVSNRFGSVSDNASGTGYYWGTGGYYMISKLVSFGVAARVTSADVDFGGGDISAGGTHLAATISFFLD